MNQIACSTTAGRAIISAALLIGLTIPSLAPADTVTIPLLPVRTNTLYESATGSLSGGHSQYIFAGLTGTGSRRRGLIAFDLAGQIPAGGTLQNAALELHCSITNAGNTPIELHRVTADWGSGSSVPSGNGGSGAAATFSDATWLHRFYDPALPGGGTQRWSTPGGDFDAAVLAATPVSAADAFFTWSSPQLTALVASWAANPAGNYGLLVLGDESAPATARRFDSQLYTTESSRPHLILTVLLPTPPHCLADVGVQGGTYGHDGSLDNNDFISFIDLFFLQSPEADLGQQGGVPGADNAWDNNDFILFIDDFFNGTGCV